MRSFSKLGYSFEQSMTNERTTHFARVAKERNDDVDWVRETNMLLKMLMSCRWMYLKRFLPLLTNSGPEYLHVLA